MLIPNTRFTVKNSARNAFDFLKRATSGVYHHVQQTLGHGDDGPLSMPLKSQKFSRYYNTPDMFKDADTYASRIGQGMLRLFGPHSSMRADVYTFLGAIVTEYGYRADCLVMAMQILDRFLLKSTVSHAKERIYHYAFVSLMIAVEVIHGYIMPDKLLKRYVDRHCSNKTIKRYRKEVLKSPMGAVSVPNVFDLLMETLDTAAIECSSAFDDSNMFEGSDATMCDGLSIGAMPPHLFNPALVTPACQLVAPIFCDQRYRRFRVTELASACFFILAERLADVDMSKTNNCARHSYKDVEPIVNYLKTIV
ncbi:hypothetical protein LPJ53_003230 [Coemansia erecta]|uniref:Cyclin N-terminal domain-containing protein n=1 Tax=Coemansia erecta TaxID=147472 RepID=A0A9W7Y0L0_9FUNG|nr:hypothetical protein LPJ53_003230 [Coemansia erecta]